MLDDLSVVVLAAGKGTRMRTQRPKVLHRIAGRTMLDHVLAAAATLAPERIVVVLADGMEQIAAAIGRSHPEARVAIQSPQQGTGHALMVARDHLPASGEVLVLYGDTPLITSDTLGALRSARAEVDGAVAVMGFVPPDRGGYGRLRFDDRGLAALVEERHADEALKRDGICNAGIMALDGARLGPLLDALVLREGKNEFYLTDVVEHARARGWACTAITAPWVEGIGVNSQAQLAAAEAHMQARLRLAAMDGGATLIAPETVFFSYDTRIGQDVEVHPQVVFGPGVVIEPGATIFPFSHLEGVRVAGNARIGPFARLRPGADIGDGARIGNFVEVKAATVEAGAKINHLSYIGDARIGADANVGAGTITCNYDGFAKHRTEIGAGAFIGSNTALVAPVRVGDGAIVGAGSTIVRDVPEDALSVARGEQRDSERGGARFRAKRSR
jgi:bifunctional UDP-N-acetylglucosamine pyrophosphorylase/glucosamine-1-phosphate N-acetyltransferase